MDPQQSSRISRILKGVVHGSTPFISTFVLIHLSAPIMANVGGSSLASSTMLLGREIYQTPVMEPTIVLLPITAHILSSILLRLTSPSPRASPRSWKSPLSITGFALALLVPIHFLTHRAYPSLPADDAGRLIGELSPSELDYEYVKYGLRAWPIRSWIVYGTLALGVSLHIAGGIGVMWERYAGSLGLRERMKLPGRKARGRIMVGGLALPVLAGLWWLAREEGMATRGTVARFRAAYEMSSLYMW